MNLNCLKIKKNTLHNCNSSSVGINIWLWGKEYVFIDLWIFKGPVLHSIATNYISNLSKIIFNFKETVLNWHIFCLCENLNVGIFLDVVWGRYLRPFMKSKSLSSCIAYSCQIWWPWPSSRSQRVWTCINHEGGFFSFHFEWESTESLL